VGKERGRSVPVGELRKSPCAGVLTGETVLQRGGKKGLGEETRGKEG